jgi:hypothetical protein
MFSDLYRDKCVILLARDPRDIVVSQFYQYTKRGGKYLANDAGFLGDIEDYIFYRHGGLPTIVEFYNLWASKRYRTGQFALMFYEDICHQPRTAVARLLHILGVKRLDTGLLDAAVEFGQLENLRSVEREDGLNDFRLRPFDLADPESYKIRQGRIGGYRDFLSGNVQDDMDRYIARNLNMLFKRYSGR